MSQPRSEDASFVSVTSLVHAESGKYFHSSHWDLLIHVQIWDYLILAMCTLFHHASAIRQLNSRSIRS